MTRQAADLSASTPRQQPAWWHDAVVYQVYIRSFADGDGDGIGDIAGIRSRLPYLADLGIDAIWVTPWYLSPQNDGGYDVTDYRVIDPVFGTVDDAAALIEEAHAHGIRIIPDIVPKHTSIDHEWFIAALAGAPGGPERARYFFRPGRGDSGELPPNNWPSMFGGPAWTRITEPDGTPGEWYLHMHAAEQPDLDWECKEVSDRLESDMRFWFDRGVDGFRIDVARALSKDSTLPDLPEDGTIPDPHPYQDQPRQHEIYRRWRRIADEYPGDRTFVAEMWSPAEIQARYLRGDQLDTAFNIQFLFTSFDAASLRRIVDDTLSALDPIGAPATWVLSNHDFMRHPNRYGRPDQTWNGLPGWVGAGELDLSRGLRRARSAALLSLALPGSVYVYQGDELGLPEVEDLPDHALRDPTWEQSGHTRRGRDGCRVPLPWSGDKSPFGFGPEGSTPWLPQPQDWADLTVDRQLADRGSFLNLYRSAIGIRRANPALGAGGLSWVDAPEGVLAFTRAPGFLCIVNLSERPYSAPADAHLLLASDGASGRDVAPDAAGWFMLPG